MKKINVLYIFKRPVAKDIKKAQIGSYPKDFFYGAINSDQNIEISVFDDGSYTFILKTSPAASLILKAIGREKGSGEPNKTKVGKITKDQVKEIAEAKMADLNARTVDQAMKIVEGTARSMGVDVL